MPLSLAVTNIRVAAHYVTYAGLFNLLVHGETLWTQAVLDEGGIILNERYHYEKGTRKRPVLD